MVYAALAARWLLALVFVAAAAAKLADRRAFAEAIDRYEISPRRLTPVLSGVLPGIELVVGLALALGVLPAVSGWCATAALLLFAVAVAVNLLRGRRFDCGCGGAVQREIGWPLVIRDVSLAALGALVALAPAGLALWTGGLDAGHITESTSNLASVPLAVIVVATAARSLMAYRSATHALGAAN